MYENNQDGAAIYGTLDDLRVTLHSGGLVRVYFPGLDSASDVARLHMVNPDHVCAELAKRIRYRKSEDESAESDAYWALAMVCTSGHFEELRRYVGTGMSEAMGVTFTGARWYVKYHSMTSMGAGTIRINCAAWSPVGTPYMVSLPTGNTLTSYLYR